MTKARQGDITRDDILKSATRLFSLHGYFHTSTNDILEAVSMSKGAFYYHFKSKQELALAVLEHLRREYQDKLFTPVKETIEPNQRMRTMFDMILKLNTSGRWNNCLLLARLAQEMTQQESQLSEKVTETVNWLIAFWTELISEAQTLQTVRTDLEARVLAELIVSVFLGAFTCRELSGQIVHLKKIIEHLQSMINQ